MPNIAVSRLAALAIAASACANADASGQRSFVSAFGVDNPACSVASPCRQLAAAVAATSGGGEVIVLDSAGYGPVTITKSVSIIAAPGVYAGISVFSANGLTIAAAPTDMVLLRGLTISGLGGTVGIRVTSARNVTIEDCEATNFSQNGILIEGGSEVYVARTSVRGSSQSGIVVDPSGAGAINLTLVDSAAVKNGFGGVAVGANVAGSIVTASIWHVAASDNGTNGFTASENGGAVTMAIVDSIASGNSGNGIFTSGNNATVIVSGSSLVRNGGPDFAQGTMANLRTAGNNAVTGRGAGDVSGVLTPNPLK